MKMRIHFIVRLIVAAILCLFVLNLSAAADATDERSIGKVSFENSGNSAAQPPFIRGLALLHNFEYNRAAKAFQDAQKADPDFAMAYWGEAMTHNHPVWMEQDLNAARKILSKLGKTRKARLLKAKTDREKAYISALELLYGVGGKEARDFAYSEQMVKLHKDYPDDIDARAFTALSILGLAHEGRDFTLYMRSAALLEDVFPDNQLHPGVLHYMIHSYDDAVHAPLGLRAALLYGSVAPNAGHALHMTSHIFVGMGMWDDAIIANKQAMKVANRQRKQAGRSSRQCGHYNEWLIYAFLQKGEVDKSDTQIAACRTIAETELKENPSKEALELYWSRVYSYSMVSLMRVAHVGAWQNDKPLDFPEGKYLNSRFKWAYGDMLFSRGNYEKLVGTLKRLKEQYAILKAAERKHKNEAISSPKYQDIILLQASGLMKLAHGEDVAGLADLREAALLESKQPLVFGPPAIEKPSFELLGEELEKLGQWGEARKAYKKALLMMPNKLSSKEGLERVLAKSR